MSVDVCTKYDKNKIKRFIRYCITPEKRVCIRSAVCFALLLMCFFISLKKHGFNSFVTIFVLVTLSICALIAVIFIGIYYILIPLLISKSLKNVDSNIVRIVRFSFDEERFNVIDCGEVIEFSYTAIKRVVKHGNDVYLFTDKVKALIVDVTELSSEELENLRRILNSKFILNYFKWEY